MYKLAMISTVALLAGMGQATANPIGQIDPSTPAVAPSCTVGGVQTPNAGDAGSCANVGGIFDAGHGPTPATLTIDPFGNGIVVNTDTTINGNTNINGALVVDGINVKDNLAQKADQTSLDGTNANVAAHGARLDSHDATLANHETRISNGESKNIKQDSRLDSHDATLANHNTRISNGESKNIEQDSRLDSHDATLANHNTRITHVQTQADATDKRLNKFNGGGTIENWATSVNTDLSSIHGDITGINSHLGVVDNRLGALEGWEGVAKNQISDLYKRNNKAMEGVAMAMAMPSLTLEAGKTYGVSANWGTFSGENAFGGAMAVRISESWQLQGGVSLGTKEGQFGGRLGATWQH